MNSQQRAAMQAVFDKANAVEIDSDECLDFDECTAMLVPIDSYNELIEAITALREALSAESTETCSAALAAKAMRDKAVEICFETFKVMNKFESTAEATVAHSLSNVIAALPIPEVTWVDLTWGDYLELAGQSRFYVADPHSGINEFCSHEFTKAAIELFKEKNKCNK